MITITINTDNAAFGDGTLDQEGIKNIEVVRVLRKIIDKLEDSDRYYSTIPLLDINGNYVGEFKQTSVDSQLSKNVRYGVRFENPHAICPYCGCSGSLAGDWIIPLMYKCFNCGKVVTVKSEEKK